MLGLLIPTETRASERLLQALTALQAAYPEAIQSVTPHEIIWNDGTHMPLGPITATKNCHDKLNFPALRDQLEQDEYVSGAPTSHPTTDPGRIRYEPFFLKMYGATSQEVESHLDLVAWMPKLFGTTTYMLPVTRINQVNEKMRAISQELESLVLHKPELLIFLCQPAGTYNWRTIAGTNRLSNHSFGMTLDINATQTQYWQWDMAKEQQTVSEETSISYRNTLPWEIVEIFEKHGFIWGGKWYHYDTMHFEYRPELFINNNNEKLSP